MTLFIPLVWILNNQIIFRPLTYIMTYALVPKILMMNGWFYCGYQMCLLKTQPRICHVNVSVAHQYRFVQYAQEWKYIIRKQYTSKCKYLGKNNIHGSSDVTVKIFSNRNWKSYLCKSSLLDLLLVLFIYNKV